MKHSTMLIVDEQLFQHLLMQVLKAKGKLYQVKSGREIDKFKALGLTAAAASQVRAPLIGESPVNLECKIRQVIPLGSHSMFLADVVAVHAEEAYMDEKQKFHLEQAEPIVYSHGSYYVCGEKLGTFGYSIKRKP